MSITSGVSQLHVNMVMVVRTPRNEFCETGIVIGVSQLHVNMVMVRTPRNEFCETGIVIGVNPIKLEESFSTYRASFLATTERATEATQVWLK